MRGSNNAKVEEWQGGKQAVHNAILLPLSNHMPHRQSRHRSLRKGNFILPQQPTSTAPQSVTEVTRKLKGLEAVEEERKVVRVII